VHSGVGADVDQHAAPLARRHHGRERRPVDVLECAEHAAGDRPASGRVSRREERVCLPVAHALEPDLDRRALLERREADLLGHADGVGRVHDLDRRLAPPRASSAARSCGSGPTRDTTTPWRLAPRAPSTTTARP
jgi:hypothetical protein